MVKNGSNIEAWRGEIIIADSFSADGAPDGTPMATSTGAIENRYRYGGKEWESTNGLNLYDFEARFHDPTFGFLSPDPLYGQADGAPHGIAPRVYCAATPLRYVDPSGMNTWEINSSGEISEVSNTKFDSFIILDEYKHKLLTLNFEEGTFSISNNKSGILIETKSKEAIEELFEVLSTMISVEWAYVSVSTEKGDNIVDTSYKMTTSHKDNECQSLTQNILIPAVRNKQLINDVTHSHPGNTPFPSNEFDLKSASSDGDIPLAFELQNKQPNHLINFYIYLPAQSCYTHYTIFGQRKINKR